ncbi:MAG: DUF4271 domain-containing protein [Bacteroidales bacterium]|nr:DUF4271 domain-containing protein [Bacteroidales bacterium]
MMIISCLDTQQDDTTSVCVRNSIADITFYDSNNVVSKKVLDSFTRFPFLFTEKPRQMQVEARASLIKSLKPGQDLPSQPFHDDWIIGIILIAAFLYSLIRTTSKSMFPGVTRFFLFRGINDPSSRDITGLFHWQSTLLNLISFLIIALFAYFAASYYNFIPSGISKIFFWLIFLGTIISAVTLRHIVCVTAGNISGEKEVFREYLLGIYQSYRFSALFLFVLIVLMSYTMLLPARGGVISGVTVLGIMYLIRVIRLLIIFLNRNISIFYLILYLCALEILPVVISVKYFTGLV